MQIEIKPGGTVTYVTITGTIDEHSDFAPFSRLSGKVRVDLRGVRRFNSFGCRAWIDALRALASRAQMRFVACSPAVIDQLNTTYGFLGHGTVESFIGTMMCERCDRTFDHVFDARECVDLDGLPPVKCPKCGSSVELDDNVDQYLVFLREPTAVHGQ